MGIDYHTYIMYGRHIDEFDQEFSDLYEENYPNELTIVFDDMWADMKLGHVIFESTGKAFESSCVAIDFDPKQLEEWKSSYVKLFVNQYPKYTRFIDGDWKLLAFTYTSA